MATPAFMFQRQQNFRFEKTDPIVAYYLDETDLTAITHWQTQTGYTFEFHEMHDIGNPIYDPSWTQPKAGGYGGTDRRVRSASGSCCRRALA
jgi:hypothetical protein